MLYILTGVCCQFINKVLVSANYIFSHSNDSYIWYEYLQLVRIRFHLHLGRARCIDVVMLDVSFESPYFLYREQRVLILLQKLASDSREPLRATCSTALFCVDVWRATWGNYFLPPCVVLVAVLVSTHCPPNRRTEDVLKSKLTVSVV
jgi:hypothetical protein